MANMTATARVVQAAWEKLQRVPSYTSRYAEAADPIVNRIEGGKLVPCRFSELSEQEKRAAYQNFEMSLDC